MARAKIVETYWYSIDWDVEAIWQMDLPVLPMEVAHFLWILDVPIWPLNDKGYQITPNQVMSDPDRYALEHQRVLDASLSYPIDVYFNKDRWMILDGVHRLAKAVEQGWTVIDARKVPDDAIKRL